MGSAGELEAMGRRPGSERERDVREIQGKGKDEKEIEGKCSGSRLLLLFTDDDELRLEGKAEALGNREARWFEVEARRGSGGRGVEDEVEAARSPVAATTPARWLGHAGSSGTRDRARRRGLRWLVGWIEQGRSQGGIWSDGGGDGTNS